MANKLESLFSGKKKQLVCKELLISSKENRLNLKDKFNRPNKRLEKLEISLKNYNNNFILSKLFLLPSITKKRNLWTNWPRKLIN